jgi:uncharacterized protein YjbI with pentapeptide repeats
MWHWLRKNLFNKQQGFMRLAGYSCVAHLLLLAALFLSGESSEHRSLDLSKVYDPHAKIVLLPFYKVAPAELNQHRGNGVGGGGKGGRGKGNGQSEQRAVCVAAQSGRPATVLVHLGQSAAEKRATAKKQLAEKRRIEKERAEKKAKLLKKQQAKKRLLEAKRAKIKEVARKKAELKQQLAEKKRLALEKIKLKKAKLKQEVLEQAALEKEVLEKAKFEQAALERVGKEQNLVGQVLENSSAQKPANDSLSDNSGNGDGSGSGEENIIYVGRDEIDQYRENTEVYDALSAVWHPPLGIDPDRPCTLEVAIDTNGSASRVTVEASSGILVYDSSAQAAAYEVVFPERWHGKTLHITF